MNRTLIAATALIAMSASGAFAQTATNEGTINQGVPEITEENNDNVSKRVPVNETGGAPTGVMGNVGTSGAAAETNENGIGEGVPEITQENNDDTSQRVPAN